jgi:hypothetical protein
VVRGLFGTVIYLKLIKKGIWDQRSIWILGGVSRNLEFGVLDFIFSKIGAQFEWKILGPGSHRLGGRFSTSP